MSGKTRCTRSQIIWASPRKSDGVIGRPEVAAAHAGKSLLPAFTEKQIFDQGSGREKQDNNDQQPNQAHAPHHPAAHHLIHHGVSSYAAGRPIGACIC